MDTKDLLFSESHEWISTSGDTLSVGISDHAQQMLGDVVFIALPEVGKQVTQGEEMLDLESPKAAASVYAPVSGEIVAVNEALNSSPETINASPYENGWIVKIRPSNFAGEKGKLMSIEQYEAKVNEH